MIDFEGMLTQRPDDLPIGNYTMGKKLIVYPTIFIFTNSGQLDRQFREQVLRQLPKCRPC
jgi:hypothetical protein